MRLRSYVTCAALLMLLSACAIRTQSSDPDRFTLLAQDDVPVAALPMLVQCLTDGFDSARWMMTNSQARQQRRVDGYRIETLAGGHLPVVSVDVLDSGSVKLYEAKAAALINTRGERDAYKQCVTAAKAAVAPRS